MANSCPRRFQCGTIVPGWLNGELPSVQEGVVSRRVCFHQNRNCCYESTEAKVRNCGFFNVYYLHPAPYCQLRYCGNGRMVRTKCLCKKILLYRVLFFILHRTVKKDLHLINDNVKPNQTVQIEPQTANSEKFQNILTKIAGVVWRTEGNNMVTRIYLTTVTSVFHASVLLLITNFVITLSK